MDFAPCSPSPLRRLALAIPLALALAGCPDGDSDSATSDTASGTGTDTDTDTGGDEGQEEFGGGTRLKAIVWQPESGEPGFTGWHDSELDHECEFRELSDGALRCVPETFEAPAQFYADAACTQRVVALTQVDEPPYPAYAWSSASPGTCDDAAGIDIHATMGDVVSAVLYELDDVDGCVERQPDPIDHVLVGPAIDPATYVAATDTLDGGDARIRGVRRIADDGSWSYVGAEDTQLAVATRHRRTADGLERWLPDDGVNYNARFFADAACSEPVGGGPVACAGPSQAYVNDRTPSTCGELRTVYTGGDELTEVYEQVGGSCDPATIGDFHFYAVGAAIPDADFTEATLLTPGEGAGTVINRYWSAEGSDLRERAGFIDTAHGGATCSVRDDPDGVRRCLPNALIDAPNFTFFTTADCTGPRIGLLPACLGDVPPYGSLRDESCAEECSEVYTWSTEIDPTVTPLYRDQGTGMGCQPTNDLGDEYRYVELEPMDPVEWVSVTEVILD
ncbi:MAG: hypothetical protein KC486_32350 [Myxococcales bacterium]|nr:hypothetical protein [Myxococcales bacterium]